MAEIEEYSDYSSGSEIEEEPEEEEFIVPEDIKSRLPEGYVDLIEAVGTLNRIKGEIVVESLRDPKVLKGLLEDDDQIEGVLFVKSELGLTGEESEDEPEEPSKPVGATIPVAIKPNIPSKSVGTVGTTIPIAIKTDVPLKTVGTVGTVGTTIPIAIKTDVPLKTVGTVGTTIPVSFNVPSKPLGATESLLTNRRMGLSVSKPESTLRFNEPQVIPTTTSVAMQRSTTLGGGQMKPTANVLGAAKRASLGSGVAQEEINKQVSLTRTLTSILTAPIAQKPDMSQFYSSTVAAEMNRPRIQRTITRTVKSNDSVDTGLQKKGLEDAIRRKKIRDYININCQSSENEVFCLSMSEAAFNHVKYGVTYSPSSAISSNMDMVILGS